MTNFEALHPRTGGNGPDRTRFASRHYDEPGVDLAPPIGLEIDDSALTDEDRAATDRVMGMLVESGVTGRVTVGDVSGDGFHAFLDQDGIAISALLTGTALLASRDVSQKHLLDPEHQDASEALISSSNGIGAADIREGLDHAIRDARIVDAWASGPLRSTSAIKYGVPAIETDGAVTASIDVQEGEDEFSIISTENGALEVSADGQRLRESEAESVVERICAGTGGKHEDLVQNLQACISATR